MPNHPSQDPSSWAGRTSRSDGFTRSHQDPHREQEYGNNPRRPWQEGQTGRQRESSQYGSSPYDDREFYGQNPLNQNYGAYRGARAQRGDQWPRNEDRENYTAAPEYGYGQAGRYREEAPQQYAGRNYGQSYGGPSANYPGAAYEQQPAPYGDLGDSFNGPYGLGQRGLSQPGYFQAGDFSQQQGYTRSEYPEDSYLRGGYAPRGFHPDAPHYHSYSPQQPYASQQTQQGGRTIGTQSWQEREGAQRGAFGLQSTHRGRGPMGYTRSDERIREDICERLSEHHYIDASQIRVEVNQGVVRLEGSVDDRWQKYQTEDLVDATSGVKDIQNHLNVSRASQQSAQWTAQAGDATAGTQQTAGGKKAPGEKIETGDRGRPN